MDLGGVQMECSHRQRSTRDPRTHPVARDGSEAQMFEMDAAFSGCSLLSMLSTVGHLTLFRCFRLKSEYMEAEGVQRFYKTYSIYALSGASTRWSIEQAPIRSSLTAISKSNLSKSTSASAMLSLRD